MKHPRTHVSDHAVLRYLQRVDGVDVDAVRCKIGRAVDRAVGMGATGVVIDGWLYKLAGAEHGTVVVTTVRRVGAPNIRAGFKRAGS